MINWVGIILVAGGVFSITGAVLDWDWFLESRKARFFVTIFGRTGARIFYVLLGIVLAGFGVLGMLGIVDISSK
jgi:hypothetical protein